MKFFEFFIGFRYLSAKRKQGFISFNTLLSLLIVFIGVFILVVVVSVMNGFQSQIKDKILDVDSHVTITRSYSSNSTLVKNYTGLIDKIKNIKEIKSINPYVQGQALFRWKNDISPIAVRGAGKKNKMPENLKRVITKGEKEFTGRRGVYIGEEMGNYYGIDVGDRIELIIPKGRLTAAKGIEPGIERYKVLGYFRTGYYEFDSKLVLMSLTQAQKLYRVGDTVSGIGMKLHDIYKMNFVAEKIRSRLGFSFSTMTAEQKNHNLFYALKLEKSIMMIILFLVIVSAGFTIMGTLVMVVMEKKKSIGVLKAMGAKPGSIMIIFILEGFLIGIMGTMLGVILGLATALNLENIILRIEKIINFVLSNLQQFYYVLEVRLNSLFSGDDLYSRGEFFYEKIVLVPKNIYYIDSIPTEIITEYIVFIAIFAVFLSTVAAIFPAWHASKLNPVEAIRYE